MIPMELWLSEEMAKRRKNAVAKALREKPEVVTRGVSIAPDDVADELFQVNQYYVKSVMDADQRMYIECSCAAGTPPIDEATGLPSREPAPCYHASAVLLYIAEREAAGIRQGEINE